MSLGNVCNTTASVLRSTGGTTPTTVISSLLVMPLMPVSPDIAEKYKLNSARKNYYTCTEDTSVIKEGDLLRISSANYPIRGIEKVTWPVVFTGIYVEEVK